MAASATTTLVDWASLVVSELVTNAAVHARTEIVVRIVAQPDCLLIAVTDGSPRPLVLRCCSEQSTTGRGLAIVASVARRWGTEQHRYGGKTVWAEVGALEDPALVAIPVDRGGDPGREVGPVELEPG